MRQVHCDGCNRTEPVGVPKADSIMKPVVILVDPDSREWASADAERYQADLCDRCRPQMLQTFFRVPADLDPEIPAFLSRPASALGT